MNETYSALFEYISIGMIILLIINSFFLRRAWNNLANIIQRTATLHDFEVIDKESGISIIGLAHKLFFVCSCGCQIEFLGIHQKCPKCQNRLSFTPKLRRLLRQLAKGIETLKITDIDLMISEYHLNRTNIQ